MRTSLLGLFAQSRVCRSRDAGGGVRRAVDAASPGLEHDAQTVARAPHKATHDYPTSIALKNRLGKFTFNERDTSTRGLDEEEIDKI